MKYRSKQETKRKKIKYKLLEVFHVLLITLGRIEMECIASDNGTYLSRN